MWSANEELLPASEPGRYALDVCVCLCADDDLCTKKYLPVVIRPCIRRTFILFTFETWKLRVHFRFFCFFLLSAFCLVLLCSYYIWWRNEAICKRAHELSRIHPFHACLCQQHFHITLLLPWKCAEEKKENWKSSEVKSCIVHAVQFKYSTIKIHTSNI